MTFEWFKDGVKIAGADVATLTIESPTVADDFSTYKVKATNSQGSVESPLANLLVSPDIDLPVLNGILAGIIDPNIISLTFSEKVTGSSAGNASNYSINNGVTVDSAELQDDGITAVLHTTGIDDSSADYTITVQAVADLAENPNTIETTTRDLILFPGGTLLPDPDGFITAQADGYSENFPAVGSDHLWELVEGDAEFPGAEGNKYMRSLPDLNSNNGDATSGLNSPRLDFQVSFSQAGTHWVWARALATGGNDDSTHVGINGVIQTVRTEGYNPRNEWVWTNASNTGANADGRSRVMIDVPSAGVHTFNIWMREDGHRLDKFVITTDENFSLEDADPGPADSPRSKAEPLPDPVIEFTQQPQNASGTAGLTVTFSASAVATTQGNVTESVLYGWALNGVDIPGSGGTSYTTPKLTAADNGNEYQIIVRIPGLRRVSDVATLQVIDDTEAPEVVDVQAGTDYTSARIVFSEKVSPESAEAIANYTMTQVADGTEIGVISASLSSDGLTVVLKTELQAPGITYYVSAANIADASPSANKLTEGGGEFTSLGTIHIVSFNWSQSDVEPSTGSGMVTATVDGVELSAPMPIPTLNQKDTTTAPIPTGLGIVGFANTVDSVQPGSLNGFHLGWSGIVTLTGSIADAADPNTSTSVAGQINDYTFDVDLSFEEGDTYAYEANVFDDPNGIDVTGGTHRFAGWVGDDTTGHRHSSPNNQAYEDGPDSHTIDAGGNLGENGVGDNVGITFALRGGSGVGPIFVSNIIFSGTLQQAVAPSQTDRIPVPYTVDPSEALNIAFVSFHAESGVPTPDAAAVGFTEAADKGYTDLLENAGHTVTRVVTSNSPDVDALNQFDLVIISRSVASSGYRNEGATAWNSVTTPMLVMGGYVLRTSRMGFTSGSSMEDTTDTISLNVSKPNHPIFRGIQRGVALGADGTMANPYAKIITFNDIVQRGVSVNNNPIAAGGQVLATVAGPGTPTGGMIIGEWQAGATMANDAADVLAGHRVVMLTGSREQTFTSQGAGIYDLIGEDGATLFLNAVGYTGGILGEAIDAPTVSISTDNGNIVLQWSGGVLQSASDVNGPYTEVAGASSPMTLTPDQARSFYQSSN
ncbi:MAG TPA: hypothetical protein EYQ50_15835 [Verrucomicrobiales bacterium]|nr:hypothetical protein [Verrucomicrobiales bacterium]